MSTLEIEPTSPSSVAIGVAIVAGDEAVRGLLRISLQRAGYAVIEYETGAAALAAREPGPDVMCLDLEVGDIDGRDMLRRLAAADRELPVIAICAERGANGCAEAAALGAYDTLSKPVGEELLLPAVRRAVERRVLGRRVALLAGELAQRRGRAMLVGESPTMRALAQQIDRAAVADDAVCIVGESGSGKLTVARAIHDLGPRQAMPFVAVRCSTGGDSDSMPDFDLLGREPGPDGSGEHRSCFERAHGGTLYLDEIADLDPAGQTTLLRALQDRAVRRIGGTREIAVDVRVISASDRRLDEAVRAHRFREDLFYRLHVVPVFVPPLRERMEDLPLLVGHFMSRLNRDAALPAERVSPAAMEALARHDWPGNLRELQGVVHRAMLACDGREIRREHLPPSLGGGTTQPVAAPVPSQSDDEVVPLRELQRREIVKALANTGGSVAKAARRLGIGRATLYRRLAELNLSPPTVALRAARIGGVSAIRATRED